MFSVISSSCMMGGSRRGRLSHIQGNIDLESTGLKKRSTPVNWKENTIWDLFFAERRGHSGMQLSCGRPVHLGRTVASGFGDSYL
jgi:hypothetical protein